MRDGSSPGAVSTLESSDCHRRCEVGAVVGAAGRAAAGRLARDEQMRRMSMSYALLCRDNESCSGSNRNLVERGDRRHARVPSDLRFTAIKETEKGLAIRPPDTAGS